MPSSHSQVMQDKCVTCHTYKPEKTKDKTSQPVEQASLQSVEQASPPVISGGHTLRVDDKVCLKCHEDPKSLTEKWQTKTELMLTKLKDLMDRADDKTLKSYKAAVLNYKMVKADGGVGLHNPRYAQALLQYSISYMMDEIVWKK